MAKILSAVLLLLVAFPGFSQAPVSLNGTVKAVVLDRLQVTADDGTIHIVVLPPGLPVSKRQEVPWTNIQPGDWVGVDSKPGSDGAQESVAITVFNPNLSARVRKGHFPMASGDLMTNAQVDQVSGTAGSGSLVLKDGDAMVPIRIGPATTVRRLLDAAVSDLKAGTKVMVRGTANADGSLQAANLTVDGT